LNALSATAIDRAMSGIAGIFALDTPKPVSEQRLAAMIGAIGHRGPEGSALWSAPGVGLAHCRLTTSDPLAPGQPLCSADGRLVVVIDGEINNFRQLRRQLEIDGQVFTGTGDAEVVLAAYDRWGAACVEHFAGGFALALYDARERRLLVVRDPVGCKPLHYALLPDGTLIFASELRGLMAHPAMRMEVQPTAIADYFALGFVPDDNCFVRGVRKLAAGHALLLEHGGSATEPLLYSDPGAVSRRRGTAGALADELLALLGEVVRPAASADAPLAAIMTGDVESSAIVALLAQESRQPVRTCALPPAGNGGTDARFIEAVARQFATDHRAATAAPAALAIGDLAGMFDEPFADPATPASLQVAALARERVTVALVGEGGDEVFGGSDRYGALVAGERLRRLAPISVRQPLFATLARISPESRRGVGIAAIGLSTEQAFAADVCVTTPAERARLFSPGFRHLLNGYRPEERYVRAMATAPAGDVLGRAQYADLKIAVPGRLLTRLDRVGMALGLEMRAPLLDHRIVSFAASLPPALRLRGGEGKRLLRRAIAGHLPPAILAPRAGGASPAAARTCGPPHLPALAETAWFDMRAVAALLGGERGVAPANPRVVDQLLLLDRTLAAAGIGPVSLAG
jgi:asparagine synthase (glutamine-hydrolysing)